MSEPLSAKAAAVTTASVEVRIIRIGGKQMTLAVFRQLPERELLCPFTLSPHGNVWGWVHYHTKDCPAWEHLHPVWQADADDALCTTHLPSQARYLEKGPYVGAARCATRYLLDLQTHLHQALTGWLLHQYEEGHPWEPYRSGPGSLTIPVMGHEERIGLPKVLSDHEFGQDIHLRAQRHGFNLTHHPNADVWWEQVVTPAAQTLFTQEARYTQAVARVREAGQLFIAV